MILGESFGGGLMAERCILGPYHNINWHILHQHSPSSWQDRARSMCIPSLQIPVMDQMAWNHGGWVAQIAWPSSDGAQCSVLSLHLQLL